MSLSNWHSAVFLLPLLLLSATPVRAERIPVCGECRVRTIKQGVAMSAAGDTLLIKEGLYREYNITIDKPLTLLGENLPVVDGEEKGEIFRIVSDHVSIQGLSIINVGVSYTSDHAAIRVVRTRDFQIEDNRFENLFFGIFLEKSSRGGRQG